MIEHIYPQHRYDIKSRQLVHKIYMKQKLNCIKFCDEEEDTYGGQAEREGSENDEGHPYIRSLIASKPPHPFTLT